MTMLEDLLSGTQDTLGLGLPQPSGANSGDSGTMTPDGIELRRKLALAMLQSGQEYGPVKSPLEGWNRVLQSMLGTYNLKKLDAEDAKGKREADEALISVFAPGTVKPSGYGAGSVIKPVQPAQPEQPAATSTTERAVKPASYGDTEPAHIDGAGPQLIRAVIGQESDGNPNSVSPTGARGLMQVQPQTGANPGYGVRPLANSSSQENVRFGTDYLNAMLRKYNGDQEAALIAYNGGPARADAWLKAGRNDSVIPRESANYYKQVKARMGAAPADDAAPTKVADASGGNYANDGGSVTPESLPGGSRRADQNSQLQQRAIQLMRSGNQQSAKLGRELLIKSATMQAPEAPAAVQEYEYSVRQGYNKTFPEWQHEQNTDKRQQTNVNVAGDQSFAKNLNENLAKDITTRRGAAQGAVTTINSINDARKMLDSSAGVITGAGAEWKVGFGKVLQAAGVDLAENGDAIANTEAFGSQMANQVLAQIKTLGANPSNADREFIEKAAGGKVTLNEQSIRKILDIGEKTGRSAIKTYNADAQQIDPKTAPYRLIVDEPEPYKAPEKKPIAAAPAAAPVDLDKPVPVKTQRIDPQTGNAVTDKPAAASAPKIGAPVMPDSLPDGAIVKDPEGKRYRIQGGQPVPIQ